jgi:hypothetical protein
MILKVALLLLINEGMLITPAHTQSKYQPTIDYRKITGHFALFTDKRHSPETAATKRDNFTNSDE